MVDQAALDEVFPNNPLKEVAFEIRFPLNLRIMPEVHRIQDELGSAFIEYAREEILAPDLASPQTAYKFTNPERGHIFRVFENKFAIAYTKYETFEKFVGDVSSRSQKVCDLFRIKYFDRIGLRYINHIPIPSDRAISSIFDVVNPYISREVAENSGLHAFRLETHMRKETCSLTTRTGRVSQDGVEIYVYDLDAFVTGPIKTAELRQNLNKMHRELQIEFLSHVTEEYKNTMRRPI